MPAIDNQQTIKINNRDYIIIDSIQNLRAEDSFIVKKNKLEIFKGNGESRKYVGSYSGKSGNKLSQFFDYNNWGNVKKNGKRTYPLIQKNTCFFSKNNLLKYMNDAKVEYEQQEQIYKNDISEFFDKRLKKLHSIQDEKIFFSIYDVSDLKKSRNNRGYIRSDDEIWDIWRKLILPQISYLSILKLLPLPISSKHQKPLYYFRVFLDYQFRSIVHPKLLDLDEIKSSKVGDMHHQTDYRKGAQEYRKKVLNHMPQCPFTRITDERLLIASHIKPYNICLKESNETEANDHLNGLSFSPTYDKLFDQGYITFLNTGELICGTQLSKYTWEKLNIDPTAKNVMRIYPEKREDYLEYHRKYVFQDNIEDLV